MKQTKDVIIQSLRGFFNNADNYQHLIPPNLQQMDFQQIKIWDTEPESLREFPLIVIAGGSGDMITSGLGDFALEVFDQFTGELTAYKYGGMYNFSLTIEVGTRTTLEREFLSDLVTKALRFYLRRKMEEQGVLIQNVRYGGESTTQYDSNHIYIATINIATWSEWYDDVDLLPMKDKLKFNE